MGFICTFPIRTLLILLSSVCLIVHKLNGQSLQQDRITGFDLYKYEFVLGEGQKADSALLSLIDVSSYRSRRISGGSVEVTDTVTGLILLVFPPDSIGRRGTESGLFTKPDWFIPPADKVNDE
jgi:hypothetical protein